MRGELKNNVGRARARESVWADSLDFESDSRVRSGFADLLHQNFLHMLNDTFRLHSRPYSGVFARRAQA